jgi:hypothetical protein
VSTDIETRGIEQQIAHCPNAIVGQKQQREESERERERREKEWKIP